MADIRVKEGKKGKTYQVRYHDKSKKSGCSYKTFRTMKAARAFLHDSTSWQEKGGSAIGSIENAIDHWLEICGTEGRSGNEPVTAYTLQNYSYLADIMKSYNWDMSLCELEVTDVVAFRSWLLKNKTRYLARKTLSCFQAVLNEMCVRGFVNKNVASSVTIKSSTRYKEPVELPSSSDINSLIQAADRLANSKNRQVAKSWERYRPILYLAIDSGMRPQEYLAIAGSNILDSGVQVERAIERNGELSVPKTPASRRFIDISPDVLDMVRHYRDNLAPENTYDLVFPTATGRWQTVENWRKLAFKAVCIEAGLMEVVESERGIYERPKFKPYALRHFYASMLIEQRLNLKKIQTLMGHSNISTTFDVYGHLIEKLEQQEKGVSGMLARTAQLNPCGNSVASEA
ncbi:MAG: site-specific integrase [Candidatus Thiodiazotropha sp. (ex Troendleina suluensis)]|nr:site-specific integrase [Candidatus Thiodiazotropha sp. (ex Troendleina suluensis)]